MNDLILKAREQELLTKMQIDSFKDELRKDGASEQFLYDNDSLIKQYVQTGAMDRMKNIGQGAMEGLANWADRDFLGGPGVKGHAEKGRAKAEAEGKNQTWGKVKGAAKGLATRAAQVATAPMRAAGKAGNVIGEKTEQLATQGQQTRTNVTPKQQARIARGQERVVRAGAKGKLATAAEQAGKPSTKTPLDPANDPNADLPSMENAMGGNPDQVGTNVNNAGVDPNQQVSGGGVTDTTGQSNQTQTKTNTGQGQAQGQGQGQAQGQGQGTPQDVSRVAQIQDAQQQAQTKGGIGTGLMSNALTFGLAGALRGGYNAYQRHKGRERLRSYSQGDFSKSLQFQEQLNDAYSVIALRKGYEARNTTEMLRNGGR